MIFKIERNRETHNEFLVNLSSPYIVSRMSSVGTTFGWSSVKIGTIQRRLAWSLRKDDTHTLRKYNDFFVHWKWDCVVHSLKIIFLQHREIFNKQTKKTIIYNHFFKFTKNLEIPALSGLKVVEPSFQLAGQTSPCSSLN